MYCSQQNVMCIKYIGRCWSERQCQSCVVINSHRNSHVYVLNDIIQQTEVPIAFENPKNKLWKEPRHLLLKNLFPVGGHNMGLWNRVSLFLWFFRFDFRTVLMVFFFFFFFFFHFINIRLLNKQKLLKSDNSRFITHREIWTVKAVVV